MVHAAWLFLGLAACRPPAMNKTPYPPSGPFERGPAVTPAADLAAWLGQQGGRLLRLPVFLPAGSVGFSLRDARIGPDDDALTARLDDLRLGIGLADHAYRHCQGQPRCGMWVEGYWGGDSGTGYVVQVSRFHAPIPLESAADARYVEVAVVP